MKQILNPNSVLFETLGQLSTESSDPALDMLDTLPILERCSIQNRMDRSAADAVEAQLPSIAKAVELIANALTLGGRLFYFGAGTSGRLGVLDASECPPTFGTDPGQVQGVIAGGNLALTTAVEGAEDSSDAGAFAVTQCGLNAIDVAVGITASGRTPYVLGALSKARAVGAVTIGITNNAQSELSGVCSGPCIEAVVGPEIVAGSTRLKAGTAQKMILNILTTQTMIEIGKTYGSAMIDVQASNTKLKVRALRMVCDVTGVSTELAMSALTEANGSAKIAILMILKNVKPIDAAELLNESEGSLRKALR